MTQPIPKQELHDSLVGLIRTKIKLISDQLAHLKEAVSEDTKSSAGDKYETGREMVRQEMDKSENMLADYRQQLEVLQLISPLDVHHKIQKGTLVYTSKMIFYLAGSFGKMDFDGQEVFVMSVKAPLAQQLLGKKQGDEVVFNRNTYEIKAIY